MDIAERKLVDLGFKMKGFAGIVEKLIEVVFPLSCSDVLVIKSLKIDGDRFVFDVNRVVYDPTTGNKEFVHYNEFTIKRSELRG